MKKTLLLLMLTIITLVASSQTIQITETNLGTDTLTNLSKKVMVTDFYVSFGINNSIIDSTTQQIQITPTIYTLDVNGNILPKLTKRGKTIIIKQGTEAFATWVTGFTGFSTMILNEVNSHKDEIEKDE